MAHGDNGRAERFDRGIVVACHLHEIGRQIIRQTGIEIASGELSEHAAQGGKRGCLLRLGLQPCILCRLTLFREDGEIDRDGIVHVEQGSLDHDRDFLSQLFGFLPAEAAWPALAGNGVYELLQHERVAADIPARFKTDAGMRLADLGDALDIAVGVFGGADNAPMLFLTLLGTLHVVIVAEESRSFRDLADLVVEDVECAADVIANQGAEPTQGLSPFVIEPEETKAILKIGIVVLRQHDRHITFLVVISDISDGYISEEAKMVNVRLSVWSVFLPSAPSLSGNDRKYSTNAGQI